MNSLDLAKYIITECHKKGIKDITITKIHKLLYITYGLFLYKENNPLFDNIDDKPYCYPYGPLFPIVQRYNSFNEGFLENKYIIKVNKNINKIVNNVIKNYGNFSSSKLSSWSHREGSAWYYSTKKNFLGKHNATYKVISDELIKKEFIDIINEK